MGLGEPPQQQLARERRERLLHCAVDLVLREGLDATTAAAVADHAELRRESIGFYFGDEDNLLAEALQELLVRQSDRIGRMMATLPPAGSDQAVWDDAAEWLARGLVWLDAEDRYTFWDIAEQAHRRPALAGVAAELLEAVQDSVARLLVECGLPQGDLLGPAVCGMIHGLVSYYRVTGGDQQTLLDDLGHGLLSLVGGHRLLCAAPLAR